MPVHLAAGNRLEILNDERVSTFNNLPIVISRANGLTLTGKGLTKSQRILSAAGESMERQAMLADTWVREFSSTKEHAVTGRDFIHPLSLGVDFASDRPIGVHDFDDEMTVAWCAFESASVPPKSVLIHMTHSADEQAFYRPSSNGYAFHTDQNLSEENARSELIERDAFIGWWYGFYGANATPSPPDSLAQVRLWLSEQGWELDILSIPSPLEGEVVLGIARRRDGGIICATAYSKDEPKALESVSAEIIQTIEAWNLKVALGLPLVDDLSLFLQPKNAAAVESVIARSLRRTKQLRNGNRPPLPNFRPRFFRRTAPIRGGFVSQMVSPEALPFALPGKGRRMNHPIVRSWLEAEPGRMPIPEGPHPLG